MISSVAECLCCREVKASIHKIEEIACKIKCITEHEGFQTVPSTRSGRNIVHLITSAFKCPPVS